ncbi:MAG: hypothetical protein KDK34_11195, partial [Leptospiraceae bacterium]|nr:hypothetical protein [Leptospiraceae bacterium]
MNALRFGIIAGLAVALAALPVVLWANVVPEPRDAAAQVRILAGILTESNGRWNLQTVDLFEKEHAYVTRGASDMLEDVRFV